MLTPPPPAHPSSQAREPPRSHRSRARAGPCGCAGTDGRASPTGAHPRDPGWPWRCAWRAAGKASGYSLRAAGAQGTPSAPRPPPPHGSPQVPLGEDTLFRSPNCFRCCAGHFQHVSSLHPPKPMEFAPLDAHWTEEKAEAQEGSGAAGEQQSRGNPDLDCPRPAPLKQFLPSCSDFLPGSPHPPTSLQGPPPRSLLVWVPCSPLSTRLRLWPGLRVRPGRRLRTAPAHHVAGPGSRGGTEDWEYWRLRPPLLQPPPNDPSSGSRIASQHRGLGRQLRAGSDWELPDGPAPPRPAPRTRPSGARPWAWAASSGWSRPQRAPPPAASGLGRERGGRVLTPKSGAP